MSRLTRDLLLVLLGGVTLRVSLGDAHLAYVREGFRPLLVAAGALVLLLGLVGVLHRRPAGHLTDDHATDDHADGHGPGGPRVAWLLLAPIAVLLVVAPPALGSYTALRQMAPPPPAEAPRLGIGPDDPGADHQTMSLTRYTIYGRADDPSALEGRQVRLVGFVTPREGGGWYVSRIRISCCAADASAVSVVVDGPMDGLVADQWVAVVGRYAPPRPHPVGGYDQAVIDPVSVTPVPAPADTYEN